MKYKDGIKMSSLGGQGMEQKILPLLSIRCILNSKLNKYIKI